MENKLGFFALFLGIFFSLVIIVSNIVGFFWLNSLFILILSAIILFVLYKKFPEAFPEIKTDKILPLYCLLLIILLAYPVLLITPFFPASADAVTTTMIRVLDGTIPLDHAQYSTLNLSYQLGYPLIVNMFSELVPIQDYLWPWIIGILAGTLQLIFVYIFAKDFFGKNGGIIAATLFFGGKLVYENLYNGEFAWLLATAMFFLFIFLYRKKSPLKYLVLPAIFAIHPAVAFNLIIFMTTYAIFFRPKLTDIIKLCTSLVLTLPLILMSYLPLAYNILFNSKTISNGFSAGFIPTILAVPPWVGMTIIIAFGVSVLYTISKKNIWKTKEEKFLWTLLIISSIIFVIFSLIGFMLAGRVIELILITLLLLSTNYISKINIEKKQFVVLVIIILLLSLFFFSTSSLLTHYRSGSKASPESRDFATVFYNFNPERETGLFLTLYRGKTAEYSNKIPFDVNAAHMILLRDFSYYPGPALDKFKENSITWHKIFWRKETNLIQHIDVKYIIVDSSEFDIDLNYPIVFEHKDFLVYEKTN